MQRDKTTQGSDLTAFGFYLRTGRRIEQRPVEVKYNPWHDDEDGRFTFAGQGRYVPSGSRASSENRTVAQGGKQGQPSARTTDRGWLRSDHPDNHVTYIVQSGDSLARIAARRKGLTARDLAWLNQHPIDMPLRIGQRIKVPHQHYLDKGRDAKNRFVSLAHYMETHGGKLPPNPANPPSLESQILDANWKRNRKNGYDFHTDAIARTRKVIAGITDGPMATRSRNNQVQAGKPDRRSGDDGGHFIAARFNGPRDSFNHFAQDRNFNRGAYRAMEDGWAKDLRAGKKVTVDIVPLYEGTSKRPYHLTVKWTVGGTKRVREFSHETKGKSGGDR